MSTATEGKQAVIRRLQGAQETSHQRLLKKHLPAWVISGAFHVVLIVTLIVADQVMAKPGVPLDTETQLTVVNEGEEKVEEVNLTNPDVGLDPDLPTAIESAKLDTVNVADVTQATDVAGLADAVKTDRTDFIPPPGVGQGSDAPGKMGDTGDFLKGMGMGADGQMTSEAFQGRGGATRSKLLERGGGNSASEAAVARGMIWLAKQQKPNGSWVFDGSSKSDTIAATGLGLLPFMAAGQTHKSTGKDNKYRTNVEAAVKYILSNQQAKGDFKNANQGTYMYAHAIATLALCELLGMTNDRNLEGPAQKAVNYIITAQAADGSWGYQSGNSGDTSIVGWEIQALYSATLCKGLRVDKSVFAKARKFLDKVGSGSMKSTYGYNSPGSSLTLTPVGLLCRYYADGWGPDHPGYAGGVAFLMKSQQPSKTYTNIYYYYYATQVVHFFERDEWYKNWNPAMRDLFISTQVPEAKTNGGSWDADNSNIGTNCGRLGTTCLTLLTLEVYYRHLPLYKRDSSGLKELERAR